MVSAGPEPQGRRAARQSLAVDNDIFTGSARRTLLEWRFGPGGKLGPPIATILKHHTASGDVLVVTKVGANDSCHLAYIDARVTPEAIALARRIADERAATFDCKSEPLSGGAPASAQR